MDEDQGQNQELEIGPPTEEYALEQKVIPFMGDELAAALTQSGGIWPNTNIRDTGGKIAILSLKLEVLLHQLSCYLWLSHG